MNVKPGDMAKFVNCSAAGAVCTVIGAAFFDDEGYDWEVMMLQGISAADADANLDINVTAGGRVLTMDAYLRRIDPLAGDETPEPQKAPIGVAA